MSGSSSPMAAAGDAGPPVPPSKPAGPDPLIGRVINERFKISALIARGGMGRVYRAEQAPLGRVCAVKVLNPNYGGHHDPEFHKRFFLEASISAKLTHPNTVTIFDYGRTDDNIYFMAMEYLEGRTLHRTLREEGPFTDERCTHISRQICRSLREAHSLGVIHRDLKPANVFLIEHGDETDFVKVLDFGLVKNIDETKGEDLTQTGLFMGSPKYMAPEQICGERVDARTDIYSLGIIMYEMVTGRVPFDRPNSVNILMAHVNEQVPPIRQFNPAVQIGDELEQTILRCVEKDPERRFRTMDEVLVALRRAGTGAASDPMSSRDRYGSFDRVSGSGSFTPRPATPSEPMGVFPERASDSGYLFGGGSGPESIVVTQPKRPSKRSLVIAAVSLIGVIAAVALIFSGRSPPKQNTGGAEGAPSTVSLLTVSPNPSTVARPTKPAEPQRLAIESEPAGAQVKDDETILCDKTPCEVVVTDNPRKLTINLKDYSTETISVKRGDPTRKIELRKKPVWVPKKDDRPSSVSKDFKDSPY